VPTPKIKPRIAKPAPQPAVPSVAATGSIKVGLLLPLSGAHAELGQAMLNAAQMAVFDENGAQLELLPRDTGDDPAIAAAALTQLADQGAQIIVGPLFAAQVAAVKPVAAHRNLPVLALSNDNSLTAAGTYVLGFSPDAQTQRVAQQACAEGGKRFVALLPTGGYGDVVYKALEQAVRACAGASLAMRRYDVGTDQLSRQLQETAQAYLQIDVLMLAESATALQPIPFPQVLDGQHKRLLGTGLWDDDQAAAVPALSGGWFAMPAGGDHQRFVSSYQGAYSGNPPRLAALAYDAVALAASLQKRGLKPDAAALTNPSGFMGVDGVFRLLPNGTVERGLAVYQLTAGGKQVVSPAPMGFEGLMR